MSTTHRIRLSPRLIAAKLSTTLGLAALPLLVTPAEGAQETLSTFAGGGSLTGNGIPADQARLDTPIGLVVDGAGNIYFADNFLGQVFRIAPSGTMTLVAGNGIFGDEGDGGLATFAQLNFPEGVAVDSTGAVYVADTLNFRVRKIENGIITTVAGSDSTIGDGDGGPAQLADHRWLRPSPEARRTRQRDHRPACRTRHGAPDRARRPLLQLGGGDVCAHSANHPPAGKRRRIPVLLHRRTGSFLHGAIQRFPEPSGLADVDESHRHRRIAPSRG